MDSTQNIIELCAGYGGISMGLKRAIPEIQVRAYVEIEAYVVANLVTQIEKGKMDSAPIWTNLKTFPGEAFHGKIHGITGGYPCQPFSVAGERKGEQDPRHLFPDILRIMQAVKPLWCFFENVEGHLSLGYGEVYRSLRDLGYAVETGLFSAEECGAPHRRKRLFILGHARGCQLHRLSDSREQTISKARKPGANELADPSAERLQGSFTSSKPTGNGNANRNHSRWPARQGKAQYEWEAPRALEPGLGRTAYGASNRVDRIRMLGNGVVPDTAELAFRTLIKKAGI